MALGLDIERRMYVAVPPLVPIKNPRSVHAVLPRDLYNKLAARAMQEKVSVSRLVCVLVENGLG